MSDYSFGQQKQDFAKAQIKYAAKLKAKLNSGEITKDYYDSNIWLTYQTLDSPTAAEWAEFKTAVDQEDLQWLANQAGVAVADVAGWLGKVVGSAIGEASKQAAKGLGLYGWAFVLIVAVIIGWAFLKGPLKGAKVKTIPIPV